MKSDVEVICCARHKGEEAELHRSLTGNLRKPLLLTAVSGALGITPGYQKALENGQSRFVIFTHTDVEFLFGQRELDRALQLAGLRNTGFLGVAGTRLLDRTGVWWADRNNTSGACQHRDQLNQIEYMSSFGPYGQVAVLDGVLLLIERKKLLDFGGFNLNLPGWDFYDLDACLRALIVGKLKNYTFPLPICHSSLGDVSQKPGWELNRRAFLREWQNYLPAGIAL